VGSHLKREKTRRKGRKKESGASPSSHCRKPLRRGGGRELGSGKEGYAKRRAARGWGS